MTKVVYPAHLPIIPTVYLCHREGVVKIIFLYQQRRFAKLGKDTVSLLEALPALRKLLDETEAINQLVEEYTWPVKYF